MHGATTARRVRLAAVVAVFAVAVACNVIDPLDPSLKAGFLTTEKNDDYGITLADSADPSGPTVAAAPTTNEGGNTRVAFWPATGLAVADQQSCMSWDEHDAHTQQGIALRVRSDDGRTRAITVTKNIWYYASWIFNVHVMDSGNSETPYVHIGGFDLWDALARDGGRLAPSPWRLCARVVGDQLSFKVWGADEAEPEWMDGVHGGGVRLPAGWGQAGVAGWYVGHLNPGASTTYADRVTEDLGTVPSESSLSTSSDGEQAPRAPAGQVEPGPPLPVDRDAVPDEFEEPSTEYREPTAIARAP